MARSRIAMLASPPPGARQWETIMSDVTPLDDRIGQAGWEIGPSGCPGASGDDLASHVAGLPGQDAERNAGEHDGHSCSENSPN